MHKQTSFLFTLVHNLRKMIAQRFLFILTLFASGMMFPLVCSHSFTAPEEQNLFKNPFPANKDEKQDFSKYPFPTNKGDKEKFKNPYPTAPFPNVGQPQYSMRGFNDWLSRYRQRATATCDRFPRLCRQNGSPGPDCCKKMCVNVMTDVFNCGECGRSCRFGQMCCGGTCVNVLYDQKNCGACKNKCKKESFCNFGMCSYA